MAPPISPRVVDCICFDSLVEKTSLILGFSEFANSSPVEGISDGTLQMTFLELRQVQCDYLLKNSLLLCANVFVLYCFSFTSSCLFKEGTLFCRV